MDFYDPVVKGEMASLERPGIGEDGLPEFNTLDEPIKNTINDHRMENNIFHFFLSDFCSMRDLGAAGQKFKYVLFPKQKQTLLKEWDLWGPFMLCTYMAIFAGIGFISYFAKSYAHIDDILLLTCLHIIWRKEGYPSALMLQKSADNSGNASESGPEFAEVFLIVCLGAIVVTLNSSLLGGKISFFQSVCVLGYCLLPCVIALTVCFVILFAEQTSFLFFLRFIVTLLGFAWAVYASVIFLGDSQPPGRKALAMYPIFLFYFVISWLILSRV